MKESKKPENEALPLHTQPKAKTEATAIHGFLSGKNRTQPNLLIQSRMQPFPSQAAFNQLNRSFYQRQFWTLLKRPCATGPRSAQAQLSWIINASEIHLTPPPGSPQHAYHLEQFWKQSEYTTIMNIPKKLLN